MAINTFLRAIGEAGVNDIGRSPNDSKLQNVYRDVVKAKFPDAIGFSKWKYIRSKFYIPTKVARKELTSNFANIVVPGQFITLDEKQVKWRGASPCIKKVIAKKMHP